MARRPILVGLFLLLATGLSAQDRFAGVTITTRPIAGAVHLVEGPGGNVAVSVGPDGVLLVDDKFAPLADRIRAAVAALRPGAPAFVLNTHWHGDHVGGNEVFGADAVIIAHANVRERLSTAQVVRGSEQPARPRQAWPVVTFDDAISVHFNGEEIRLRHVPAAHTDGDAVVFFTGSRVVHLGDLFFEGAFPYVDLEHGGDVAGLIAGIEGLLPDIPEGWRVVPGHGAVSDRAGLSRYLEMLRETTQLVRSRMRAGRDLEAIQAAGLPERFASHGEGWITTERWIATIHASYGGATRGR